MAYCSPGDRLIDPPDHFKGDRIPRDTGAHLSWRVNVGRSFVTGSRRANVGRSFVTALSCQRSCVGALMSGVGSATDSRKLLDSRVHSSLVVAYSRLGHTLVGRTLEHATPG